MVYLMCSDRDKELPTHFRKENALFLSLSFLCLRSLSVISPSQGHAHMLRQNTCMYTLYAYAFHCIFRSLYCGGSVPLDYKNRESFFRDVARGRCDFRKPCSSGHDELCLSLGLYTSGALNAKCYSG